MDKTVKVGWIGAFLPAVAMYVSCWHTPFCRPNLRSHLVVPAKSEALSTSRNPAHDQPFRVLPSLLAMPGVLDASHIDWKIWGLEAAVTVLSCLLEWGEDAKEEMEVDSTAQYSTAEHRACVSECVVLGMDR
jgi:hypothetical protein